MRFVARTRRLIYFCSYSNNPERQQASKDDVLDHWELAQDLGPVHLNEARIHFGPGLHTADIPQLIGVLMEWTSLHLCNSRV